jgi:hypothetical protein
MTETNNQPDHNQNQVCLHSFKTHWAEAQIDGPMQMVARFDDVSKLLITIGGFVLGGLATMLREAHLTKTGPIIAILLLISLFFLFAVLVCYYQPAMRAKEILTARNDNDLEGLIGSWCDDLQRVIRKKRVLLYASVACFVLSILTIVGLVLFSQVS